MMEDMKQDWLQYVEQCLNDKRLLTARTTQTQVILYTFYMLHVCWSVLLGNIAYLLYAM
jgi:hypothetical protein